MKNEFGRNTWGRKGVDFMPEAGGAKVARFNLSWIVRGGEATGDGKVPGWAK